MPDLPLSDFLPAVEEQIASPQTPFVKAAYDRLLQEPDIAEDEAKQMIALCLADELETMSAQERPFDTARYQTLLDLLPALPEG